MHQLDALYEHLDELGLEPDLDEKNLEVALSPCRFHARRRARARRVPRARGPHPRRARPLEGPLEVDRLLPLVTDHSASCCCACAPLTPEARPRLFRRSRVAQHAGHDERRSPDEHQQPQAERHEFVSAW
jgi:hypothetical protein